MLLVIIFLASARNTAFFNRVVIHLKLSKLDQTDKKNPPLTASPHLILRTKKPLTWISGAKDVVGGMTTFLVLLNTLSLTFAYANTA